MGITMTTGTRYFPRFEHLAAPSEVGFKRALAAPSGVRRIRAGRLFHGVLANMIGIDLPVTDRMRRSASEP
ncbi:MAG: hypothetical protein ACRDTJ_17890 [Pseudonocardiaceae bacterium]